MNQFFISSNSFHKVYHYISVFTPCGDLNVEVGSERFELFCTLNVSHDSYVNLGLRSDSLFIEQRRWIKTESNDGQTLNLNHIKPADEYETSILESRIINETTISAWYDPSTVTSDLLGCRLRKETESPQGSISSYGVANKEIDVGCKFIFSNLIVKWPKNLDCLRSHQ